ncbi:hypothetical protein [Modicisalibacter luteus]|uniref:hypothetical protein n=1 Tax=Modicisalibacter luteus TaxID=453962 RepID=UPI003626B577
MPIVRREQVKMLYESFWQPMFASIACALLLVFLMWPVIPHGVLIGWLSAMLGVMLLRLVLVMKFHRRVASVQSKHYWLGWFAVGAFAAGVTWGRLAHSCSLRTTTSTRQHYLSLWRVLELERWPHYRRCGVLLPCS